MHANAPTSTSTAREGGMRVRGAWKEWGPETIGGWALGDWSPEGDEWDGRMYVHPDGCLNGRKFPVLLSLLGIYEAATTNFGCIGKIQWVP